MSQSLHFYAEGRIITITYSRKNFKANSYPQTSLNIRVGPSSDNHIIFELDIDNDYTFTHFPSLKAFFSSLKQMQKKDQADIVRFRDQETLAFPIRGESGDIEEEELVSLNRVEEVNMRELDEVTMRVEFYNNFKNKMIHKIQREVRKHFGKEDRTTTAQQRAEKRIERKEEEKKNKALHPNSEIIFSTSLEKDDNQYVLCQSKPSSDFVVDLTSLLSAQFKIQVQKLKYDWVFVGVECFRENEQEGRGVRRVCQFGRAMSSSFCIEQGHKLAVSVECGELVVRNASNNTGKMFDNLYEGSEAGWKCRISVSMVEL